MICGAAFLYEHCLLREPGSPGSLVLRLQIEYDISDERLGEMKRINSLNIIGWEYSLNTVQHSSPPFTSFINNSYYIFKCSVNAKDRLKLLQ